MMTSGSAPSTGRARRRRLGGAARAVATSGLLALTAAVSQGAGAAVTDGVSAGSPFVYGASTVGGFGIEEPTYSEGTIKFAINFTDWSQVTKLSFLDQAVDPAENIAILLYGALGSNGPPLSTLTLLFQGPAINADAAVGFNPTLQAPFSNATGTASSSRPVDALGEIIPDTFRVDISYGCAGAGATVCEETNFVGIGGMPEGGFIPTPLPWTNLTHPLDLATYPGGVPFDLHIALNGAIDQAYIDSLTAIPIPPAAWLLGSAMFALVGMSRARRRRAQSC